MLDPFLGIGNSAVAAQRCGLTNFVGFEIDEEYLREAKRRLCRGAVKSSRYRTCFAGRRRCAGLAAKRLGFRNFSSG